MSERPPIVLVVRGIVRRGNKILLLQRSAKDSWAPTEWELPGGKVDHKQRLAEAIAREIEEEIGAAVEVRQPIHLYDRLFDDTHKFPHHLYLVMTFECWLVDEGADLKISPEHQEARWVTLEEARALAMKEGILEAIERFSESR